MVNTTARIKKTGKPFEILVDLDEALRFKKGEINSITAESEVIFTNIKQGERASEKDLKEAFGTTNVDEIVQKIVKEGEVLTTQEHRDAEQEKKFKQVVDFFVASSVDPQTGNPHTSERIKSALEQAHVNIKNIPIENQIKEITEQLNKIIPIKIDTKNVKITIPAVHTGKVYGLVTPYKKEENWLSNGDLEVLAVIPSGTHLFNFYDKLNSATHGSALTEEVKE